MAFFLLQTLAISLPALFLSEVAADRLLPRLILYLLYVLIGIHTSVLIPGILSQLTPLGLLSGSLVSGTAILILAMVIRSRQGLRDPFSGQTPAVRWQRYQQAGIGVGLVLTLFLIRMPLLKLWGLLIFLVHPLSSWDVVTYHLPNAVDYLQAETLWTIQGLFSQYPGGNEMINLWSLVPLHSDAMLGITYAAQTLGIGLLLADLTVMVTGMPSPIGIGFVLLGLYGSLLAMPFWVDIMFSIGRNDLPLMLITLAVVWTLGQRTHSQPAQRPFWLLTTALLLGMAVSIKPTGIPFLAMTLIYLIWEGRRRHNLGDALLCSVLAAGTGGFWYLRNLMVQGTLITTTVGATGWKLSILANLLNPEFYTWNRDFWLYFGSLGVGLVFLILGIGKPQWRDDPILRLLVFFALGSGLIMLITPYGASPGTLGGETLDFTIQLRYSTVLIPLTLVLLSFAATQWLSRALPSPRCPLPGNSFPFASLGILVHSVLALVLGIQLLSYQPPLGLPSYDRILFWRHPDHPTSDVYRWVHRHLKDTTIYTVGLRPYGLYGFPFSNRVIEHQGANQYEAILQGFQASQANYLAISRDPFTAEFPEGMEQFIRTFSLVYNDALAGVFASP